MVPAWVQVGELNPANADPSLLWPEERDLVAKAVRSRRLEFAAGRLVAHRLLKGLRIRAAVGCKGDGCPDWPAGIVGSISHCATLAAVAIAREQDCAGLGIDVECYHAMSLGVIELISTAPERRWIASDRALQEERALRLFCAKEAVFKAISAWASRLAPQHIEIAPSAVDADGFIASVRVSSQSDTRLLRGRWRAAERHVAAVVVLGRGKAANDSGNDGGLSVHSR